ncbi:hypothetical protein ATY41_09335 [Leifsonia xyli subsp. xyli]|uniref:Uncharacterized protein n=1 Tax=Leifsonia xyli subsp. xyli TaxID=59736 RepID=A0A1E2SLN1_LEIXY|nr:hypothetical protein [Leifsonia xyli]ODA90620.1 hypothetical protein ATY41_09335 [Leifsonia xyli subsp. xyli]
MHLMVVLLVWGGVTVVVVAGIALLAYLIRRPRAIATTLDPESSTTKRGTAARAPKPEALGAEVCTHEARP